MALSLSEEDPRAPRRGAKGAGVRLSPVGPPGPQLELLAAPQAGTFAFEPAAAHDAAPAPAPAAAGWPWPAQTTPSVPCATGADAPRPPPACTSPASATFSVAGMSCRHAATAARRVAHMRLISKKLNAIASLLKPTSGASGHQSHHASILATLVALPTLVTSC